MKLFYTGAESNGTCLMVHIHSGRMTEQEANDLFALFPKSAKMRVDQIGFMDGEKYNHFFSVRHQVQLTPDGVNKGKNESGIKRLNTIAKTCKKHSIQLIYEPIYKNSCKVPELE